MTPAEGSDNKQAKQQQIAVSAIQERTDKGRDKLIQARALAQKSGCLSSNSASIAYTWEELNSPWKSSLNLPELAEPLFFQKSFLS